LEWYQNGQLIRENPTFWYQSLAKKHLWIYVIFIRGLSIPLTRKGESKKNGTFSKWRGLKGIKIGAF
jgi:hypothetical protein